MQRKKLEKVYNVRIYQVSGGSYVLITPDGEKRFRYMADVEEYLKRKYEKQRVKSRN